MIKELNNALCWAFNMGFDISEGDRVLEVESKTLKTEHIKQKTLTIKAHSDEPDEQEMMCEVRHIGGKWYAINLYLDYDTDDKVYHNILDFVENWLREYHKEDSK